jgi:hypothetical protein
VIDPDAIAVSHDARTVLVEDGESIAILKRDYGAGRLRQLRGRAGCLAPTASRACRHLRGVPDALNSARNSALNAMTVRFLDHDRLAVLWTDNTECVESDGTGGCTGRTALVSLARDPSSGGLVQTPGSRSCVTRTGAQGCAKGSVATQGDIVAGPGGRNAYLWNEQQLQVVTVSAISGIATLAGPTGCVTSNMLGRDGCQHFESGDWGFMAFALSSDSQRAYFAGSETILTLQRDAATGGLEALPGSACPSIGASGTCLRSSNTHPLIQQLLLAARGRDAYVVTRSGVFIMHPAPPSSNGTP